MALVYRLSNLSRTATIPPVDPPQFPNFFSPYSIRPSWQVAGVDFFVGCSSKVVFKDPTNNSNLPAGASYSAGINTVTIAAANVTLDGFDFATANVRVDVNASGSNWAVTNSKFLYGAALSGGIFIYAQLSPGPGLVHNVTFDGGSNQNMGKCLWMSPNQTVTNCYFKNADDDCMSPEDINVAGANFGDLVIKNNLIFSATYGPTVHSDGMQTLDITYNSIDFSLNTFYQPAAGTEGNVANAPGDITPCRFSDYNTGTSKNARIAFNSLKLLGISGHTLGDTVDNPEPAPASPNAFVIDPAGATAVNNPKIHDNYIDADGVEGAVISPQWQNSPCVNPVSYNNLDLRGVGNDSGGGHWSCDATNNKSGGNTAPAAPVITSGTPSGSTAVLNGTSGASLRIAIYDPNASWPNDLYGTTTASAGGAWTFTSGTLSSGVHSFVARAVDAFSNASALSNTQNVTI